MSKIIELENNSYKTITYYVKYEGSSDFVLEDLNNIKIEGKSSYKYKVFINLINILRFNLKII